MSAHDRDDAPRQTPSLDGGRQPGTRAPRPARSGSGRRIAGALGAMALVLLVALGFSGSITSGAPSPLAGAPTASGRALSAVTGGAGASAGPPASPGGDDGSASTAPGGAVATPAAAPATGATALADVAIVPVTQFRTGRSSVRPAEVAGIATGASPYGALVLVRADAAAELAALGLRADLLGARLVQVASADALMTALAKNRTWLGFLRADQVGPGVRALDWGPASLFGETRVRSLGAWPLRAQLPVAAGASTYDPATAWTLYAAGDLALDRGAAVAIRKHGNNPDYLYDGGRVTITGHCKDCSQFGWDLPYTKRLGGAGAVRALITGADLAIANMEEVAVTNWTFHEHGTVFTGNPAYLAGIRNAGFDWVSMANNHVGDAGPAGVLQSMAYLTRYGLLHGGAGPNTKAAHTPSIVTVGGIKVGLLSLDTVAPVYNATATRAGSARMTVDWLKKDVAAARAAGAQLVIVWPHWGVEYTASPSALQRTLGHAAIDAGADMVIGNHPHWAQAMEVYRGRPIWYALGNYTFDQTWSEPTMEGISLEMTFSGSRLVQAWLHPHLVLDYAQPNLMDPMGSGKVVLDQIFKASKFLPW